MTGTWIVFRKELTDALRDRKTLLSVLLSSVLIGPVMLIMLSVLFGQIEQSREQRVLYLVGGKNSPALVNFFERQSYEVRVPPSDYREKLLSGDFNHPVLEVPDSFLAAVESGQTPVVTLVTSGTNRSSAGGAGRIQRMLSEYWRELRQLELAAQGVSPASLKQFDVQETDLATAASSAAQFTSMLPIFIVMAILYGALNAAMDSTAGERERGSLEPLLMNPTSHLQVMVGKWAAVAVIAMLTATLAVFSFFPAQWMIQTESLKAMFNFGLREAVVFLLVLLPFAASTASVFMAVAIRCKTFKEAHANNTFVLLLISMVPLITVFDPNGERAWYYWVPGLAQQIAMTKVLKLEDLNLQQIAIPALVSTVIALVCIRYIEKQVKRLASGH
jgi:sodium transport system permease protein